MTKLFFKDPEYKITDLGYKTPCWFWLKATDRTGYGVKMVGGRSGKLVRAHRYYYELSKGPIPEGLTIDHLCRIRCCVNPEHMEPVTLKENSKRGGRIGGKVRASRIVRRPVT